MDHRQDDTTPHDVRDQAGQLRPGRGPRLSRRSLLQHTTAAATLALVADRPHLTGAAAVGTPPTAQPALDVDLTPHDAIDAIMAAIDRYPLVAVTEFHYMQEWHDVLHAVLFHPALPQRLTDIVVEFGNSYYQELADRFVLGDRAVAAADVAHRIVGPGWDAPVYAEFIRTVRALNWMRPPERRIRVLLGHPPLDLRALGTTAGRGMVAALLSQVDAHYATVVEREVLRKGRRALLIGGSGHLLRGLHADGQPQRRNAASLLVQRHPGALFVVDALVLPPGEQGDRAGRRLQATFARWPRPALAYLAGTWLGATTQVLDDTWINELADRALSPAAARYDAQADAILYLGPGEALTASQADPAIYHWGAYWPELKRLSRLESAIEGRLDNLVADGLRRAQADPTWFAQDL